MAHAFIIHGSFGKPTDNWFPWLKLKLEENNLTVRTPQFPTPEGQNLTNWLRIMENHRSELTGDTLLIGHSIACTFILDVLELMDVSVRACFLVAGWTGPLHNPEFDPINETIADRVFNWSKIRSHAKRFYVINAVDDPYVPFELGVRFAQNLGTHVIRVEKGGHFNQSAGYTEFPLLLEKIKAEMKMS